MNFGTPKRFDMRQILVNGFSVAISTKSSSSLSFLGLPTLRGWQEMMPFK